MAVQTLTITRTILGINPIGNNIWQIEFNPAQTQLTSDVSTSPVIYYSSSALPVILNPFLNNIGNFNNSDYNAIINNATINRLSEYYKQIDYATAQTVPVNFEAIISGTAYPASVQDSNYTSYQYSGIRYWGSKNTTDNFNSPLTITSSIVQTYQNDNLGLTTLGYPSIQIQNCLIAEFSTGGGTSLEIMNKYATFLGNLYQVGTATGDPLIDRDNITIIRPIENFYYQSVELWAGVREQMQIIQYSSTAKLPQPSTVFAVLDYLTPASSDFCIFSNFTGSRAIVQNSLFQIALFDNSGECAKTISNNITGSAVSASALATSISSSLADGNRMFISVYNPRTLNSLTYGSQQQTIVPLPIEIDSIGVAFPGGEPLINLKEFLPTSTIIDSFGSGSGFSAANNEYGMLIFTAGTGTSIIFDLPTGNSATGIGKGAIIEKFNNRTINEQFNYITRTFGENTVT